MKILVTGGSGLVGWQFVESVSGAHSVSYTHFGNPVEHPAANGYELDLRDADKVNTLITTLSPDVVVHTAAMTNVDKCEQKPRRAEQVNVDGTENIVSACEKVGSDIVFVSSSFVFSGELEIYEPTADRNPVNVYGWSKAEAEKRVQNASIPSTIVRTDQPYNWSKPWQTDTMVEWILGKLSNRDEIAVFDDWFNMPTYIPDLVNVLSEVLSVKTNKIYHAVGPDYLNRYEWAKEIASTFGHDPDRIKSSSSKDADLAAVRPAVRLSVSDTYEQLNSELVNVKEGLKQMQVDN